MSGNVRRRDGVFGDPVGLGCIFNFFSPLSILPGLMKTAPVWAGLSSAALYALSLSSSPHAIWQLDCKLAACFLLPCQCWKVTLAGIMGLVSQMVGAVAVDL